MVAGFFIEMGRILVTIAAVIAGIAASGAVAKGMLDLRDRIAEPPEQEEEAARPRDPIRDRQPSSRVDRFAQVRLTMRKGRR